MRLQARRRQQVEALTRRAQRAEDEVARLTDLCEHYGINPEELPRGWYSTSPTAIYVTGEPGEARLPFKREAQS